MADVHNPNLIADDVSGAQFTTPAGSASIGVCAGDPNGVVAGSVGDHVNEEGTTRWWVNVDGGTGWAVPPMVATRDHWAWNGDIMSSGITDFGAVSPVTEAAMRDAGYTP